LAQSNSFLAISVQSPSTAIYRTRPNSLPTTTPYSIVLCLLLLQSVRVSVDLRLAVYRQLLRLGDKPLETHDQHFFLFK
jgi:hypothetical protein